MSRINILQSVAAADWTTEVPDTVTEDGQPWRDEGLVRIGPKRPLHGTSIGSQGYSILGPIGAPNGDGCALVSSVSGSRLGWTVRPPLIQPFSAAGGTNDYFAADGTWKSIAAIGPDAITSALGYTPVNKAGDTNVGSLTIGNGTTNHGSLTIKNTGEDLLTIDNTNNGRLRLNATGPHGQYLEMMPRSATGSSELASDGILYVRSLNGLGVSVVNGSYQPAPLSAGAITATHIGHPSGLVLGNGGYIFLNSPIYGTGNDIGRNDYPIGNVFLSGNLTVQNNIGTVQTGQDSFSKYIESVNTGSGNYLRLSAYPDNSSRITSRAKVVIQDDNGQKQELQAGAATFSGNVAIGTASPSVQLAIGASNYGWGLRAGNALDAYVDGNPTLDIQAGSVTVPYNSQYAFSSGPSAAGSPDVRLYRKSSGVLALGTIAADESGSLAAASATFSGSITGSSIGNGTGGTNSRLYFGQNVGVWNGNQTGYTGLEAASLSNPAAQLKLKSDNGVAIRNFADNTDASLTAGNATLTGGFLRLGGGASQMLLKANAGYPALEIRNTDDTGYVNMAVGNVYSPFADIGTVQSNQYRLWNSNFQSSAISQIDVRADSGLRIRNVANTADSPLTAGDVTASSLILYNPNSSFRLYGSGNSSLIMGVYGHNPYGFDHIGRMYIGQGNFGGQSGFYFTEGANFNNAVDVILTRGSQNQLTLKANSGFRVMNLAGDADAPIQAGAATFTRMHTNDLRAASGSDIYVNANLVTGPLGASSILSFGAIDARGGITNGSSQLVKIIAANGLAVRNASDNADASLSAGTVTASGTPGLYTYSGTAIQPAITFLNANNTGPYLGSTTAGSRDYSISTDGAEAVRFEGSNAGRRTRFFGQVNVQMSGSVINPAIVFNNGANGIWADSAGTVIGDNGAARLSVSSTVATFFAPIVTKGATTSSVKVKDDALAMEAGMWVAPANLLRGDNTPAGALFGSGSNHPVMFVTNGYGRMTIGTDGNIESRGNITVGEANNGAVITQRALSGWGNGFLLNRAGTVIGGIGALADNSGPAMFVGENYSSNSVQLSLNSSGLTTNTGMSWQNPAFSSTSVNIERANLKWNGNFFEINTEQGGLGNLRNIRLAPSAGGVFIQGSIYANTNNVGDVGSSGNRFDAAWFNKYCASLGSASAPSFSLNGLDTGMWFASQTAGSRAVVISTDGVEAARFGGAGSGRTASFSGDVSTIGNFLLTPNGTYQWNGRGQIAATSDGAFRLSNSNVANGVTLDVSTDGDMQVRNRANTANAVVTAGAFVAKNQYSLAVNNGLAYVSAYRANEINFISSTFSDADITAGGVLSSKGVSISKAPDASGYALEVVTANSSNAGIRLRPQNLTQQVIIDWQEIRANNSYMVGTQTGALRLFTGGALRWDVTSAGHLVPATTATYEIGEQYGIKPANVWVSSVVGSPFFRGANATAAQPTFSFLEAGDTGMSCPTAWNVNNRSLVFSTGGVAALTLADSAGGRSATFAGNITTSAGVTVGASTYAAYNGQVRANQLISETSIQWTSGGMRLQDTYIQRGTGPKLEFGSNGVPAWSLNTDTQTFTSDLLSVANAGAVKFTITAAGAATFAGDLSLANNKALLIKDTAGTDRAVVRLDNNNAVDFRNQTAGEWLGGTVNSYSLRLRTANTDRLVISPAGSISTTTGAGSASVNGFVIDSSSADNTYAALTVRSNWNDANGANRGYLIRAATAQGDKFTLNQFGNATFAGGITLPTGAALSTWERIASNNGFCSPGFEPGFWADSNGVGLGTNSYVAWGSGDAGNVGAFDVKIVRTVGGQLDLRTYQGVRIRSFDNTYDTTLSAGVASFSGGVFTFDGNTTPSHSFYFAPDTGMSLESNTAGQRRLRFRTDGADAMTLGGSGVNRRAEFSGKVNVGGARLGTATLEVRGDGTSNLQEWRSPAYGNEPFVTVLPDGLGMNIGGVYVGHPNSDPLGLSLTSFGNGGMWLRANSKVTISDGSGTPVPVFMGAFGPTIRSDGTAVNFRNNANSADAPITAGAATFTGDIRSVQSGADYAQILTGSSLSRQIGMCWDELGSKGAIQTSSYGFPITFNNGSLTIAAGNGNGTVTTGGLTILGGDTRPAVDAAYSIGGGSNRWNFGHINTVRASQNNAGSPSYSFGDATNTGMYLKSTSVGSRAVAISTDGVDAVVLGGSGTSRAATFAGTGSFTGNILAINPTQTDVGITLNPSQGVSRPVIDMVGSAYRRISFGMNSSWNAEICSGQYSGTPQALLLKVGDRDSATTVLTCNADGSATFTSTATATSHLANSFVGSTAGATFSSVGNPSYLQFHWGARFASLSNNQPVRLIGGSLVVDSNNTLCPDGDSVGVGGLIHRGDYQNYKAGMGGTTNYERGFMRWNSNTYEIGLEKGGTGNDYGLRLVSPYNINFKAGGTDIATISANGLELNYNHLYPTGGGHDLGIDSTGIRWRDVNLTGKVKWGAEASAPYISVDPTYQTLQFTSYGATSLRISAAAISLNTTGVDGSRSALLSSNGSASVAVVARGVVGQTADIFRVENASGVVLAGFGPDGSLRFGNAVNSARLYVDDPTNGPLNITSANGVVIFNNLRLANCNLISNEDMTVGPTANNRNLTLRASGTGSVVVSHPLSLSSGLSFSGANPTIAFPGFASTNTTDYATIHGGTNRYFINFGTNNRYVTMQGNGVFVVDGGMCISQTTIRSQLDSKCPSLYWGLERLSIVGSGGYGNGLDCGTITQGTADARWRIPSAGVRVSEVGDGVSAWQTGYSEEYSAGGIKAALFGATRNAQPTPHGVTAGRTGGSGNAVKDDDTFTGGVGSSAYTLGDIVRALKEIGALAM